jgi:NADH-quinone oxidoreductase subunit M
MPDETLALLLPCLIGLPAAAAAVVALLGPRRGAAVRWVSLATALVSLGMATTLAFAFATRPAPPAPTDVPGGLPTFRPVYVPGSPGEFRDAEGSLIRRDPHATSWDVVPMGRTAIQFYVGLDGLNVWLVLLTAVLFLPGVLVSWLAIEERVNEFYAWLMLLQTSLFGVFLAFDVVLFYAFFELSLVPLFFLIGIWGGAERQHAARKFLIYTLAGSLVALLGILGMVATCYWETNELTFSIPRLVEVVHARLASPEPQVQEYWGRVQFWVFVALTAGFAVKVPLVPLHTWLPLAHVQAPTAGSVDLAGILLKIGAYGFLRLCVPLAPDASLALGLPLLSGVAAFGVVYGALCAYAQQDVKKLVAYSSVSHVGLLMVGMFAFNMPGLAGSLLQMINHGLISAALFLVVGMMYDRYHTRNVGDYGGLAARLPRLACFMVFFCLASAGLPGLNGFVGEVLVFMGVFDSERARGEFPIWAVIAATGVVLGAWYLMTMLRRVFFGPLREPAHHGPPVTDLSGREVWTLLPIAALCVVMGVYPQPVLNASRPDLEVIADIAKRARDRADARAAGETSARPAEPTADAGGKEGVR